MDENDPKEERKEDGKININFGGDVSNTPVFASTGDMKIDNQQINYNSNNTSDSNNIIGSHNTNDSYNTTITITDAFKEIYEQIETRPEDPNVGSEEIVTEVQYIEQELTKGEKANENKIKRWLGNLANMAPDIFDVAVSTMINPVLGISEAVRKIAVKAKGQYGNRG